MASEGQKNPLKCVHSIYMKSSQNAVVLADFCCSSLSHSMAFAGSILTMVNLAKEKIKELDSIKSNNYMAS